MEYTRLLKSLLTLFKMGFYGAAHGWVGLLSKICYKYLQWWNLVVIPILIEIQKNVNHVIRPFTFADINIFSLEISKLCYIKKCSSTLFLNKQFLILLTLFESWKAFLINMIALMISTILASLGLLKIKVFWSKDYDVIISAHDVTNKSLFRVSNYIVNMVMWLKYLVTLTFLWEKLL